MYRMSWEMMEYLVAEYRCDICLGDVEWKGYSDDECYLECACGEVGDKEDSELAWVPVGCLFVTDGENL